MKSALHQVDDDPTPVLQTKVYGFDSGFVSWVRGWEVSTRRSTASSGSELAERQKQAMTEDLAWAMGDYRPSSIRVP